MAVETVGSVVIQKLTDMLTQESVINERRLVADLKDIKESLERMGGYFLDAEAESKRNDEQVNSWAQEYLKHLYHVEDAIEGLTSASPCCNPYYPSRGGCHLGRIASKLTFSLASLNLSRKMKKIRHQIDELRAKMPHGLEDLSVKSTLSATLSHRHHIGFETNYNIGSPAPPNDPDSQEEILITSPPAVAAADDDDHPPPVAEDQDGAATNHPVGNGLSQTVSNASLYAERLRLARLNSHCSFNEDRNIVGLKKDVEDLIQTLVGIHGGGGREVVSIVGKRGSGKTTLARAVYGNGRVKQHFMSSGSAATAWVTASKNSSNATQDLWLKLFQQITSSKAQGAGDSSLIPSTSEDLKARIFELLEDKRYFIVLDDVESSGMWDDLKTAFPDQKQQENGSKILLITCNEAVATAASNNHQVHHLKNLNDSDSRDLFLRKAGSEMCPEDPQLKIPQVCNGLPLNIVLLGSLLSTKKDSADWRIILSKQAIRETLDLISLCYDDLQPHLKLCLIYMVLFPKEFDIPVRRLQRLWMAEGFVSQQPDDQTTKESCLEDLVKEYFHQLVQRSLIQVSKLTSDGSPKRCRLLGVLHDHLLPKAQVISLFHVHNSYTHASCRVPDPVLVRRLVEYTDIKHCSVNPTSLGSLRSYLSFNTQLKDTPATEVGKLLTSILSSGLRLLRVLDLEGVYKPSLPDNLGDFFHLRYLGLRWTFLDTLPESVGHLYYLETLDIKHTYISKLPPFIWKMKHLKHLTANWIYLNFPTHSSCSSLPQLITLLGFSIDDFSFNKDGCLKNLFHIRELAITFQLSNSDGLLDWVSNLSALQMLRLRSKDEMGWPSELKFKSFSSLKHLTHLNLLGKLPKLPPDVNDFPQELKVVTLSVSGLKDDPMPVLGKLPKLTVLGLLADSYVGDKMNCPAGGFKELRVLKLWMLKKLENWDVEKGAMDQLKQLNIRCCKNLGRIPDKLLEQIEELTLTSMSQEIKNQVKSLKSSNVVVTIKEIEFSPLPWEEDYRSPTNNKHHMK